MTTRTPQNAHCSIKKMCKQPVLLLLLLSALVGSGDAQAKEDWSMRQMCESERGGTFTPRDSATRPGHGDTCTGLTVGISTENEIQAEYECQKEYPHHVNKATPGPTTKCDLETGLICKKEWRQIYGRCFKLFVGHKTRKDAEALCKKEHAEIAFLHRAASAERYFMMDMKKNQIWVEASEVKKQDLMYREGKDLMLVFYGQQYRVQNLAIILVDGSKDMAHTLCEYTPPMTWEESSYLIKKYSEIYWKGFTNEEGMFIRTANQMTLNEKDYRDDEKYCQNAMKPFISPNSNRFSGAYPSKMFLQDLLTVKDDKCVTYVRTPARFEAGGEFRRNNPMCNKEPPKDIKNGYFIELRKPDVSNRKTHINDIWKPGQPVLTCDGGSWSTAIRTLPKRKDIGMETMSDARRAPIYCQVRFSNTRYDKCPSGWVEYKRPSGMVWCHLHQHQNAMNEKKSKDFCAAKGAYLDGYENRDEYEIMKGMIKTKVENLRWGVGEGKPCWRNRIGGRRRKECVTDPWNEGDTGRKQNPLLDGKRYGFHPAPENACSRRNVFQWENNVASEPPSIVDENWNMETYEGKPFPNPSYRHWGRDEQCLEILSDGDMNDYGCGPEFETCFFCGKEAAIIKDN